MGVGSARAAVFLVLFFLASPSLVAGELADFNAAVEKASVPYRAASGYLRSGNLDQANSEIENIRKAWAGLTNRFGAKPPDAFDGNILYASTLADVGRRITRAARMVSARRPEAAREALVPIRAALSQMRRASGVIVLADCVLDANAAMDDFSYYKDHPPDWTSSETRFDIAGKSAAYRHDLKRCESMAPEQIRADPQFSRLIEGAYAGLDLVQKAINTRDTDLLNRVLNELRSFDTMLILRYG